MKTVKNSDGNISFMILAVYVDDIVPISNDIMLLAEEKNAICDEYKMVDNGEISYILGMAITRNREEKILTISQKGYVDGSLERFGMDKCRPVTTPLESGAKYHKTDEGDDLFDVRTYQQVIGSLTYAAICTRPDIASAVGVMSQFMSNPNQVHWTGVKRILRYLKGTSGYGLMYKGNDGYELSGYSDADWAGDINTRRSTSGFVFQLGTSTISWCSRKQATVAKSSTEAE